MAPAAPHVFAVCEVAELAEARIDGIRRTVRSLAVAPFRDSGFRAPLAQLPAVAEVGEPGELRLGIRELRRACAWRTCSAIVRRAFSPACPETGQLTTWTPRSAGRPVRTGNDNSTARRKTRLARKGIIHHSIPQAAAADGFGKR